MPHIGRKPAIVSRTKPTGQPIFYPICGEWTCDDYDYDWETVRPDDPYSGEDYAAIKREHQIAMRHEPRQEWRQKLREERDRLSGGDPLWWGRP
jgi:hypothetical protein